MFHKLWKKFQKLFQQFYRRFFRDVVAAIERTALDGFGTLRPVCEGAEAALDRPMLAPQNQKARGELAIEVGRIVFEVDRFCCAVILAARVNRGRIAKTLSKDDYHPAH